MILSIESFLHENSEIDLEIIVHETLMWVPVIEKSIPSSKQDVRAF